MASGIKGDMRALRSLRKRLSGLRDPKARSDLARLLAEDSIRLVNDSFRREVDPWDVAWKPSMRASYTAGQTLSDTGVLRRSITYNSVSPIGFRIGSPVKYANIHQWGGVIRAKTARGLRFALPVGFDIATARTNLKTKRTSYRRIKKAVLREAIVVVQKVTMPPRSFLPRKGLAMPPRWRKGWEQTTRAFFERKLGT